MDDASAARRSTDLLLSLGGGDDRARDDLMPLVYDELRRIASVYLQRERPGHTLTPTDLVHEAYLGLAHRTTGWGGRTHFLCTAAQAMRHILVSHARAKGRLRKPLRELLRRRRVRRLRLRRLCQRW